MPQSCLFLLPGLFSCFTKAVGTDLGLKSLKEGKTGICLECVWCGGFLGFVLLLCVNPPTPKHFDTKCFFSIYSRNVETWQGKTKGNWAVQS